MQQERVLWLLATLLPIAPAVAENTWIYPNPNSTAVFNYVDVVNTTWTSDFINPYLILWCQEQTTDNAATPFGAEFNKSVPSSGSRSVTLDYGSALGCHFELHQYEVKDTGLNSGVILIEVRKDKDPVTWSQNSQQNALTASGAAIPAASSTVSPAAATSSAAPASATTSAASTAKGGLNSGARAGLGVGVSLGVLAIGAIVAFFIFRRRRSRNQQTGGEEKYEGNPVPYHPVEAMRVPHHELAVDPPEMEGKQPTHELPATAIGSGKPRNLGLDVR